MRSHTIFNRASIVIMHIIALALLAMGLGQPQHESQVSAANHTQLAYELFLPLISNGAQPVYYLSLIHI